MGKSHEILTVTWSADLPHFYMLRKSLDLSGLKNVPHDVVVQSEDLHLFEDFDCAAMNLIPSKDILPAWVEKRRRKARRYREFFGRRLTTLAGSMARRFQFPRWIRFMGWQTQQLIKLHYSAKANVDDVIILDSDVVVSRMASLEDFESSKDILCFDKLTPGEPSRKVQHWEQSARQLFACEDAKVKQGLYFDTPFILNVSATRAMLSWVETQYHKPWMRVFLAQAPRRWSEFASYKTWLHHRTPAKNIDWREAADLVGYIFDARDVRELTAEFDRMCFRQGKHYITRV